MAKINVLFLFLLLQMLILKNVKNPIVWYFQSETGPNYYKEVPLSEILAVDSAKNHSGKNST